MMALCNDSNTFVPAGTVRDTSGFDPGAGAGDIAVGAVRADCAPVSPTVGFGSFVVGGSGAAAAGRGGVLAGGC